MDLVPEEKETRRPHQAVIRFVEHPDQADHEDRHGSLGLEAVPFSARANQISGVFGGEHDMN